MENIQNTEQTYLLSAEELALLAGGFEVEIRGVKIKIDGTALADGVAGFIDGLFGNAHQ